MLATLNLQLLPAEIADETLHTSTLPVSDGEGLAPAGFADLLQLRVDESVALPTAPGELLPLHGSELPLEPGTMPSGLPAGPAAGTPAPEPLGHLFSTTGLHGLTDANFADTESIDAEIILAAEIAYQPAAPTRIETAPAVALPAVPSVRSSAAVMPTASDEPRLSPVLEARSLPFDGRPLVTQPLPMAEPVTRETVLSNRNMGPASFVTALPPEQQAVNAIRPPATAEVDRSTPLPELPLRPTVTASADRGDAAAQELASLLRARPVVAQPAQALHAQLNLQQPANLVVTPAPSAVSSDLSYTLAAQQATDLISTSVRDSVWGERVGERVVMMAGNQLKSAEIRLTPAELGPLRVQVAIDDGAANVTFHAQHAVTRDALEQALPRLREMLAENGLTLGNAEVGDDGVRQGNRDAKASAANPTASGSDSGDGVVEQGPDIERHSTVSRGLVDTFA